MKRLAATIVLSMAVVLLGCGLSSAPQNPLTGNWTAGLLNSDGSTAFGINATLTQNGQTLTVTKFSFAAPSSCFAAGTTATALLTMADTTHGTISGSFAMTLQSGPSNQNGANTLTLQGALARSIISGTWTLTGTGTVCNEVGSSTTGNFSMVQMVQM
jgi:hypothetical protein